MTVKADAIEAMEVKVVEAVEVEVVEAVEVDIAKAVEVDVVILLVIHGRPLVDIVRQSSNCGLR